MRRLAAFTSLLATLLVPASAHALWTDVGAGLTGVSRGATAWGDYDGDGDLDLAIAGQTESGYLARLYRNDGGTAFVATSALPASVAVTEAALAWGDYDRDGDLDLAIAGNDSVRAITRVLRNDDSSFVDTGAELQGVGGGDVAWGDYDEDGDLDLAVTGASGTSQESKLYRNTGTGFVEDPSGFARMASSALAWGDYDNDGDLDLVHAGLAGTIPTTLIYRNLGTGAFTPVAAGLVGVYEGAVAWGDYDNDGDLDLAVSGRTSTSLSATTRVYRNNAGSFTEAGTLQTAYQCALAWGDWDNDGDLDLVLAGTAASASVTVLYRNTGTSFVAVTSGLAQIGRAALAWGDFDGDTDLDLAVAGLLNNVTPVARIYRNVDAVGPNSRPSPPSGLSFTSDGTTATFAWNASGDAQGGSNGLHYNLRVGSVPGAGDLVPPMARADGWRRVATGGNVGLRRQWSMPVAALGGGNVYWSVQAIDQAFAGSAFAAEQTVGVEDEPTGAPRALRLDGANPFHGESRIACALASAEPVAVTVHDPAGRLVRSLVQGMLPAGVSRLVWRGDDDRGRAAPPGLYFVRLRGKGVSASLRIAKLE